MVVLVLGLGQGAYADNRCAQMLRRTVAAPGNMIRRGFEQADNLNFWIRFSPEPKLHKVRRLFFRPESPKESKGFLAGFIQPVRPIEELGRTARFVRYANPAHWISRVVLGRPRRHSFHLMSGINHLVFSEPVSQVTQLVWGKRFQFSWPMAFAATFLLQPTIDFGLQMAGFHPPSHKASETHAFSAHQDESKLLRNDYRFRDISLRYPEAAMTPELRAEALREVRERRGLYDLYFDLGFRDRYYCALPDEDDLRILLQFPTLKPLKHFATEGIPSVPGYALKPGVDPGPISNTQLVNLVRLVDQQMVRDQIAYKWLKSKNPATEFNARPEFAAIAEGLNTNPTAQDIRDRFIRGELNAHRAAYLLQEITSLETEFAKCGILGIIKVDPDTGTPQNLPDLQRRMVERELGSDRTS